MVRTTKSASTTAPVETDKSKSRAKKSEKTETPTPVVEAPPADLSNQVVADTSATSKITEFSSKLQQLANLFASLKSDFKTLEKSVARDLKTAQKSSKKSRRFNGTRQPSGFVKPTKISDELATFLGKTLGIEMARTEVSKEINQYIRAHLLQDKENGRKIHPDGPLKKLLNVGKDDELTYFNLQRYMKHHFVKQVPATAPTSA